MDKPTKKMETGYHELTGYDLAEEVKFWEKEKTKAKKELEELQDKKKDISQDIEKLLKRKEEFQKKLACDEILFKEAEKKLEEEQENIRRVAEKKEVLEEECRVVSRHIQELSTEQERLTAGIQEKNEKLQSKTGELQKREDELPKKKVELDSWGRNIKSRRQDVLKGEQKKENLLKEIPNLKNQKQRIENAMVGLSARFAELKSGIEKKGKELQEKNAALTKLNKCKNKPKKQGRKILALVLGLGLFFVGISVYMEKIDLVQRLEAENERMDWQLLKVVSEKEEAEEQLANVILEKEEAEEQLANVISEKEKAEKQISDAKACAGDLLIKVNNVYNAKEDGSKLSDQRIAGDMRYLMFDFDVLFLKDDIMSVTIYLDIYNPDGTLRRSSIYSPAWHTCSLTVSSSGEYRTGWGYSEKSTYEAGTYRVDFIYMNNIVCSEKVDISR